MAQKIVAQPEFQPLLADLSFNEIVVIAMVFIAFLMLAKGLPLVVATAATVILLAGGVWIPVNPRNAPKENVGILRKFSVEALFFEAEFGEPVSPEAEPWSMKAMIRLMVMSRAFRQSSQRKHSPLENL